MYMCIMHQYFGVDTSYGFWLGLTSPGLGVGCHIDEAYLSPVSLPHPSLLMVMSDINRLSPFYQRYVVIMCSTQWQLMWLLKQMTKGVEQFLYRGWELSMRRPIRLSNTVLYQQQFNDRALLKRWQKSMELYSQTRQIDNNPLVEPIYPHWIVIF
jgi:hypothetical protein